MSQLSQRDPSIVCQLTNDTIISAASAPHMSQSGSWRVLKRDEASLCLPDCSPSTQAACASLPANSHSSGVHIMSNYNKETHNVTDNTPLPSSSEAGSNLSFTKTASFMLCTNRNFINEDRLRYAQAKGPNTLKGLLPRTPDTQMFCTLPMNAKKTLHHTNVRLCHTKSSEQILSLKIRDQSRSGTNVSITDYSETTKAQLTHTDEQGRASMVDIGEKLPTRRTATATATVILGPTAFRLLQNNQLVKGDALAVAQLSGIMASKQTSALIPLCHPLPLDHTSVTFDLDHVPDAVVITGTCRTTGRTGVEMEALTAVSVAALTVYDMCKAVSHDIIITDVKLVSKTGGKRDFVRHPGAPLSP